MYISKYIFDHNLFFIDVFWLFAVHFAAVMLQTSLLWD